MISEPPCWTKSYPMATIPNLLLLPISLLLPNLKIIHLIPMKSKQIKEEYEVNTLGSWGHMKDKCSRLHGKPPITSPMIKKFNRVAGMLQHLPRRILAPLVWKRSSKTTDSDTIKCYHWDRFGCSERYLKNALVVHKVRSESWTIDSVASDHMTGNASFLRGFILCTHNYFVKITDGSLKWQGLV